MYSLHRGLPWQGLRAAKNKQKYEKIGKNQTTAIMGLCEGFPSAYDFICYGPCLLTYLIGRGVCDLHELRVQARLRGDTGLRFLARAVY